MVSSCQIAFFIYLNSLCSKTKWNNSFVWYKTKIRSKYKFFFRIHPVPRERDGGFITPLSDLRIWRVQVHSDSICHWQNCSQMVRSDNVYCWCHSFIKLAENYLSSFKTSILEFTLYVQNLFAKYLIQLKKIIILNTLFN
jgi:hypothetical protein